ncbi:class I SAM-dependent methyltransferase [Methyloterricola oryzae]|uniref:class I SAM-dependent methyltransferase n=1 Tax=Methyloterricola oryzae TaxID=1495050 RepID=UPI0005EBEC22|nr:class I SAM-dependent methyltransferase [Methyloterricola oryzae]
MNLEDTRFAFGENWQRFLAILTDEQISAAEASLKSMLNCNSLEGLRLLDAGSGSGLFSLAARRAGAIVHSFDFDPNSVACTQRLREKYFPDDPHWTIEQGSVLDKDYLSRLGLFDIVYSWGVLHHTGHMWQALDNIIPLVEPEGKLFIAIYNDAGKSSKYWWFIKRLYNRNRFLRPFLIGYALLTTRSGWIIRGVFKGRPLEKWRQYGKKSRGMSAWHDLIDWVGGFPYEYAKPEEVFDCVVGRGGRLVRLRTMAGGTGCNEFVFAMDRSGK